MKLSYTKESAVASGINQKLDDFIEHKADTMDKVTDHAVHNITGEELGFTNHITFREVNGVHSALLNVQLRATEGQTTVPSYLARLRVQDSQESTRNGAKRVMLKVSIPYQGLDPESESPRFAPRRSSHDLTAHIVFTLPKECVEDLKGKAGALGVKAASAQIALVCDTLLRLVGSPTSQSEAPSSAGMIANLGFGGGTVENVLILPVNSAIAQSDAGFDESNLTVFDPGANQVVVDDSITSLGDGRTDSSVVTVRVPPAVIMGDTQNIIQRALISERPLDPDGTYGETASHWTLRRAHGGLPM